MMTIKAQIDLEHALGSTGASRERLAHAKVLDRAFAVYQNRDVVYRGAWRAYGWRGALFHLRTCVERAWRGLWDAQVAKEASVDDLIDAINYAAFAIRCIEEDNRDGNWFQ